MAWMFRWNIQNFVAKSGNSTIGKFQSLFFEDQLGVVRKEVFVLYGVLALTSFTVAIQSVG